MNLICPHCRKTVNVADQLAGQTARCPQCGGPFTVPPTPGPQPPVQSSPFSFSESGSVRSPDGGQETSEQKPAAPSPPDSELHRRIGFCIRPGVVKWIPSAALVLLFVLLFFPWVQVGVGGRMLVSQSGAGIAFGMPPTERHNFLERSGIKKPPAAAVLVLYFIILLIAVQVVAGVTALTVLPAGGLKKILAFRSLILGGLIIFAFLFLSLQLLIGFPLERYVLDHATEARAQAQKVADEQHIASADLVTQPLLARTGWLSLTFWTSLVGVVGSLLDFWLERRLNRPPPRIGLEW